MKSTGDDSRLVREVADRVASCGVDSGRPVVVGCSGGSDSTALLLLLLKSEVCPVICAHFDHGLRTEDEAQAEAERVSELAQRYGAAFEQGAIARGALEREARKEGASLEEWARRARYGFLAEVCGAYGAPFAATGHTQDDQVETVIMRLMQGSDVDGLSGMSYCSPLPADGRPASEFPTAPPSPGRGSVTLLRPLLGVSRARLRAYLEAEGISFVDDPSNTDTKFLRNAVRRYVVPEIERVFPGFRDGVSQSSSKLADVAAYLRDETETSLNWRRREAGPGDAAVHCEELYLPRATFFAAPAVLQRRALFGAFNELGTVRTRIPYRFVQSIPHFDPQAQRRILARGHGIVVEVDERSIRCRRDIVPKGDHGYLYTVAKETELGESPSAAIRLDIALGEGERRTVRFAAGTISPPLIARSRRAGDVIALSGGSRPIKKLFSDHHVPVRLRDTVPILEDRRGILAVLGESVGSASVWRHGAAGREPPDGASSETAQEVVAISFDINEVTEPYAG